MRGGTGLYIIQMDVTGDFKVGRSDDVERRISELQTGSPRKLKLLVFAKGQGHLERHVHQALREYRCRYGKGEWFREIGFGQLPDWIYNLFPAEVLENADWWKPR